MSASRADIAAAKRQLYGTPPAPAPAPPLPDVPSTTAEEAPTMPEDTKAAITCTDCGYEAISPNGLAVHRGRAHHSGALPHANGTAATKAPPAKAKPAKQKQAGPPPTQTAARWLIAVDTGTRFETAVVSTKADAGTVTKLLAVCGITAWAFELEEP